MITRGLLSSFGERKSTQYGGVVGRLIADWMRDGGELAAVSDDHAMRIGAVSACVRLNASVLASLPLHVFRLLPDGSKERVRAGQNSLVRVLQRPNAWQTGLQFRALLQAWTLLHGNGYAWINWTQELFRPPDGSAPRNVDRVAEMIPIHPSRVVVERPEWKSAPTYAVIDNKGAKVAIPSDEMFHLSGLSLDGTRGLGVIEANRLMLQSSLETLRYTRQFWENDATPGVAILYDHPLTPERAIAERERWNDGHAKQARRTAVLSGGVKLERMALSAEDSQFLQTREFQAAEIAGLFLTPPHLIGMVTKSTSWGSGIEEQHISWVTNRLGPDAKTWEETIAAKLIVRDEDYFAEHVWNKLLAGDSARRSAFYKSAILDGWMTRNEVRARENMNPLPGLDEPLVPLNMQPTRDDGDGTVAQEPTP